MRIRLTNWRLWLILSHRWLGIGVGIVVVLWTLSGFVLMYYGLPHLTAGERLTRLPPLDVAAIRIGPEEAAARVDGEPTRIRLSMLGDRPVYRINTGRVFGRWTLVYADTGDVFAGFDPDAALDWLRGYVPEAAGTMSLDGSINGPDLYTHNPGMQTHMPMHRIALNDAAGTVYYVSASSGEAVMKTDRIGRLLGFLGYELHTFFFWRQQRWWSGLLQWLSWIALVMGLLGLWLGIWRFALEPRYAHRGVRSRSPYQGLMKWHHYAGLAAGVFAVTWIFSGLVSMSVIPGVAETLYTPAQIAAGARSVQGEGPRIDLAGLDAANVRAAAAAITAGIEANELELFAFGGEPWYLAYRTPTAAEATNWRSLSAFDFITPTLHQEHRLVRAHDPGAGAMTSMPRGAMLPAAQLAMPEASVVAATWLDAYDDYYYNRHPSFDLGLPHAIKTLPVLRVQFDDALGTWFYLSPSHGQMLKFETRDRANRWGYYGLHALDFAFLWRRRPLWDIVVIGLLVGVALIGTTTLLPMVRRLRRHGARLGRWRGSHSAAIRKYHPDPSSQVRKRGDSQMATISDVSIIDSNKAKARDVDYGLERTLCSPSVCGSKKLTVYKHTIREGRNLSVDAGSDYHLLYVMATKAQGTIEFNGAAHAAEEGAGVLLVPGESAKFAAAQGDLDVLHMIVPKPPAGVESGLSGGPGYFFNRGTLRGLSDASGGRVRRFCAESSVRLLDGKRLTPTNAIQAGEMHYHEGGSSPYHQHFGTDANPDGADHCYMTFKGRGKVEVGETSQEIEPGTLVYFPPGVPHRLRAQDGPLDYFEIQAWRSFKTNILSKEELGLRWYYEQDKPGAERAEWNQS